jgi:hypothetical protein
VRAGTRHGLVALLLLAAACCSAQPPPPPPNSGLLASSLISWGQSLTGSGTQLATWTGSGCSASWKGVTCTGGTPTAISLAGLGLTGNISCAVATVTTLTRVDLVRNCVCFVRRVQPQLTGSRVVAARTEPELVER